LMPHSEIKTQQSRQGERRGNPGSPSMPAVHRR
jgi:hypothetical protein